MPSPVPANPTRPGAAALLGFAMVGRGCSNLVPVPHSAFCRQRAMPANPAVAAVATLGFSGILAGPGLIGLVARAAGLPAALLGVTAMPLAVAASARIATG